MAKNLNQYGSDQNLMGGYQGQQQPDYYGQGPPPPGYPPQNSYQPHGGYAPQQPYPQGPPQPQYQPNPYAAPSQTPYAYNPNQQQYSNYPPPQQGPPPPQDSGEKFKPTSAYKDVWATLLFLATLAAFGVCAAVGLSHLKLNGNTNGNNGNNGTNNPNNTISLTPKDTGGILAAIVGSGAVLTVLYFMAMQKFAGALIKISMVFNVVILVALAVYYFSAGILSAAIIWLLMAALSAYFFWSWRSRIPLAKIILETVTTVTTQFPGTLVAGFIGLVLVTAFNALWVATFAGMMQFFNDKNPPSNALRYVAIVFLLFALYYVTQVISNTVHVTVSGLFATYYFMGQPGGPRGKVTVPVSNPTAASAKRAVTTSFGSICFGSLIIAILQTIRALLRIAADQNAQDGNAIAALCAACAACCIGIIESLIEYFNKWAFVQVAVYGKDYIRAAKDTWMLCKQRGVDAIINDQLIGSVLGLGGTLIALICGFIAYLYVRFSDIPDNSLHYGVFVSLAVVIGASEFFVMSNVIDSGNVTTFVCLAEDPAALQRTKPELYESIRQAYPQVQFGAHV
ncbi:plasma-membrane choline transporter-domain-containing protein [Fimicolochytrium jonesii]|uniref:plasma-membrane choline transporter-domain-containing protein n=1 Tax=Fimicolochytrium jonesii TaxID=1396493 RepID=UPI0022FE7204|nr:plasma-membrane choline transporter-domain-containing protein [Fimicolochytrium jonesii]KAI8821083.1 plasma-membrane choline transporter-domain-containing protein [Fimicolochytrium jonesii]